MKRDKIGMRYESLHIMDYSVCNDVIPILLPAVYCGFGRCASQRCAWWNYFLMDGLLKL